MKKDSGAPPDLVLPVTPHSLERAADIIRRGGLVAFPTETVYGLGAGAFDKAAVRRVYAVKGRPALNPLIVHIARIEEIERVAAVTSNSTVRQRFERLAPLWPGPLSILLPRNPALPDETTAGLPSVAVRIPRHPVALELISRAGTPLAAPSANVSTYVSPTTAAHVADGLGSSVDLILDGGACDVGVESTIVSLVHPSPTVLRHGGVTLEVLERTLGEPVSTLAEHATPSRPLSPGLLQLHYAPRTPVIFRGEQAASSAGGKIALVTCGPLPSGDEALRFAAVASLSPSGDLEEAARNLFATLRQLDSAGFDLIVVEECPRTGLGRAIMDRLSRAAATRKPGLQLE
jgi:L-threonylcarbamoyladenylate synthase